MNRIGITTGDPDGIGLEVAVKALLKLKFRAPHRFYLWCGSDSEVRWVRALRKELKAKFVSSFSEALDHPEKIVVIQGTSSPVAWVEEAALACSDGRLSSMVTAPLSKTLIQKLGRKELGHTGLLKTLFRIENLHMAFVGNKFSVVLVTDHIPLCRVQKELTASKIVDCCVLTWSFLQRRKIKKPIAILGVNPHAGDGGLIGTEEHSIYLAALSQLKKLNIPVVGPLVPDVAFRKENWEKYGVFVSAYHDQGLIPFKLIHGFNGGVHTTLGLPILRTSVDHGTAQDIFGKNVANPGSMLDCLKFNMLLS